MSKAERQHSIELEDHLLRDFAGTFVARPDVYALQRGDGRYVSVKKPLHIELITAHLIGDITLGAYAIDTRSQARWICFDADTPEQWAGLLALAQTLRVQDTTSYIEPSRRGGHLWLFFAPLSGADARRFGQSLLWAQNLEGVELFPKQDKLTTGPGSLVRLPLGYHRLTGRRYHFIHPDGSPIAPTIREQIRILAHPERAQQAFIDFILGRTPASSAPASAPKLKPTGKGQGETLSVRLKDRITVYEFVSQYAQLDESGRGHCPFHEDHHKSFGVDAEGNFWHCFAGCGGGSIIDFWMKWRETRGEDPSFTATITDLADMLF